MILATSIGTAKCKVIKSFEVITGLGKCLPLKYHLSGVVDPDPGSGAFLTLGSGLGKESRSGSGIRDELLGSYFRELRNNFLG